MMSNTPTLNINYISINDIHIHNNNTLQTQNI
jgi:hypothetical protein